MEKPKKVLCKRSLIIGEPFYYDKNDNKVGYDNRMLVAGDWYDVVHNDNDNEETFSIIDNQGNLHLHWMYEDDKNYNLSRTYAKWFYTPSELEVRAVRKIKSLSVLNIKLSR